MPAGWCARNQEIESSSDIGTNQNSVWSTSELVIGAPIAGPDSPPGATATDLAPGGFGVNASSRRASSCAACLLCSAVAGAELPIADGLCRSPDEVIDPLTDGLLCDAHPAANVKTATRIDVAIPRCVMPVGRPARSDGFTTPPRHRVARRPKLLGMTGRRIDRDDPRTPDVRALLERHLAFCHQHTPAEDVYALDVSALLDPSVSFFSCREDGALLGVGALKRLDERHAEIKSMHTAAEARGRGVGRELVAFLVDHARDRGFERISLETGTMEAFAPARALYTSAGFESCERFADYPDSPTSAFMTLHLGFAPA